MSCFPKGSSVPGFFKSDCHQSQPDREPWRPNGPGFALIKSACVRVIVALGISLAGLSLEAQTPATDFKVIGFYTGKSDQAHISFVREANQWFASKAAQAHFSYTSTTNWADLNDQVLGQYQVVMFLDTRPETRVQREAFQRYMEKGGAWMGFHFAGFALTPSAIPQNWDWYHNEFLGAGSYVGNTWRPTSAVLRVEDVEHPATGTCPKRSSRPQMSGINGATICEPIPTSRSCCQLIRRATRWGPGQKHTKSGTRVIILSSGRTSATG